MELMLIRVIHNNDRGDEIDSHIFIATTIDEVVKKVNGVKSCLYDKCDIDKLVEYKHIDLTSFDYSGESLYVEILDSTKLGV